jgi:1-acyl-sn-glycerol-3-phosphate acyltransferase
MLTRITVLPRRGAAQRSNSIHYGTPRHAHLVVALPPFEPEIRPFMSENTSHARKPSLAALTSAARFILGFTLVAIASTLTFFLALGLLPSRVLRIKLCNYYGKIIGYSITRIAGVRPVFRNRERLDGSFPAIYVANHTSTLDAFLSIWLCPVGGCGVMKKEVTRVPFFGQLYLLSGHLRLDRANKGQAVAALDGIAKIQKKHRLGVWIMPEGTRSKDGRLRPFKLGFVHLAIATGLPVVPVVLHGVHKNWVKGTWFVQPTTVEIEVLEPVSSAGWRVETAREHAAEVHAKFVEALREDQKPLEDAPLIAADKAA